MSEKFTWKMNMKLLFSLQVRSIVFLPYVEIYKRTKCRASQDHSATYRQTYKLTK